MALDWSTIKAEHVMKACDLLLKGDHRPRVQPKGLFLIYRDQRFPAKHAVRLAYCLANKLPLETALKFSSGEGTVKLLRGLGFAVERAFPEK